MPCYKSNATPNGFSTTGRTSYATEADCNQACKEGACCNGTTCSVKPACQCQGTGQVFKGVGTVCTTNLCGCCGNGETFPTGAVTVTVNRTLDVLADSKCGCGPGGSVPSAATRCRDESAVFSQYGVPGPCTLPVFGQTPQLEKYGTVGISSACTLYTTIDWSLNPCGFGPSGTLSQSVYYAWPFVKSQTTYSAIYYSFLFVDGAGTSTAVLSTSSTVPNSPPHPFPSSGRSFFYAGAVWSVSITVNFA
jgi:hypothetical protein